MKVIHRGQVPSERVWQGECIHCKSVMECKEGELPNGVKSCQREGEWAEARCPVCGKGFFLYLKPTQPVECSICDDPACTNPGGKH